MDINLKEVRLLFSRPPGMQWIFKFNASSLSSDVINLLLKCEKEVIMFSEWNKTNKHSFCGLFESQSEQGSIMRPLGVSSKIWII